MRIQFKRRLVVVYIVLVSYRVLLTTYFYYPGVLHFAGEGYLLIPTSLGSDLPEDVPSGRPETRNVLPVSQQEEGNTTSEPYYESLQALHGRLRCWNPELRCETKTYRILSKQSVQSSGSPIISAINNSTTSTAEKQKRKILALVDPALSGGYRNQFMRFVAFTTYAVTNGFDQMLLPSIRWSCDHTNAESIAVPFQLLFDVGHWNSDKGLPTLVDYNESEHFDWDPFTGLFRGACDVLGVYLHQGPDSKSVIFDQAQAYEHPVPYGGGNSLGTLFYDYIGYDARRRRPLLFSTRKKGRRTNFMQLEAQITRAMKPSETIQRLVRETLGGNSQPIYMALHARFEPDMLVHALCQDIKVYNISNVFDMIRGMDHSNVTNPSLYIAINMAEMKQDQLSSFQSEHRRNVLALDEATNYGLKLSSGKNATVFAGAYKAFQRAEVDVCAHEIVSSVVSFEIAIQAKIFIGTYVSSWSTAVWKARHSLGRGENYAYTRNGLENIGAPKPFQC